MKAPLYHRMFGYDPRLLPNAHLAALERGVETIEDARARTGLTIGYPGWGMIYHLLLCHLDRSRSELIIETGSNQGCTTIILAQALIDSRSRGKVVSIELDPGNAEKAKENFAQAGVSEYIELIVGSSHEWLPRVLEGKRKKVRFAFLDAAHLFDDVRREFEAVLPALADDAIVMFDNTYQIATEGEDPRVNGFLKTITSDFGGNLINLEFVSWFTPGLAIWQKKPAL